VIALTDTDDGERAERIVKAGAKGCILRNVGLDTLLAAIRTVLTGGVFYSNEIAQQLLGRSQLARPNTLERLTAREREVLLSILNGFTDMEIAERLHIERRTIDKHRQHIHYSWGTRTPLQLVQAGLRLGLLPRTD
jgi:DNA-binding NarL/FixJ family response regulator